MKSVQIEKLAKHCHKLLLIALCVTPLTLSSANVMADNVFSPSSSPTEEQIDAHPVKDDSLSDMLNNHIVRSQSLGTLALAHFNFHLSDIEHSSDHPKTGAIDEKYKFAGSDIMYGSDGTDMNYDSHLRGSKDQSLLYSISGNNLTLFTSDDSDCHGDVLKSVTYKLHSVAHEHHGKELILYPVKYQLENSSSIYIVPKSSRKYHPLNLHTKSHVWEYHNENNDDW